MATVEDIPQHVSQAILHLTDLGSRMRSKSSGFKEQDVNNIDVIIEAISELENQRSIVHDQLEAETIKCSILRHELKYLPGKYRQEIHDAVVNARQSNQDLVERLNAELTNIEANIIQQTARHEFLENDNTVQLPERDRLRVQHEQVITVLNQRMAEKASKQITLNETRDKLRITHAKILDLEDELLQLKEDMIKERADVRAEKSRLRTSINEAKEKTTLQNKENAESKSQLDLLLKRLGVTDKELDDLRKIIYKSDVTRAKAEGQERSLSNQINKQLRDNDELRKSILDLQRRKIETEQKYKSEIESMQKKVEQLKSQIKVKEQRFEKLKIRCDELNYEADIVSEKRAASQTQVSELMEFLQEAKQALVRKQENIARMREETSRMEEEIVALGETHLICVENFNRQIEEYREQLGKERKERMDVQQKKDVAQKALEEFKSSNNRFMATVNKKVTQGKEQHESLTQEGTDLQKGLKELDEKIHVAKITVREERLNFDLRKAEVESQLSALKSEIKRYEDMSKDVKEALEVKVPAYAKQTEEFNETQAEFDRLKKQVTGMKSQKASLEDQVKRTKLAIEKAIKPQPELNKELKTHRETFLANMKSQLSEAAELERQVYVVGTKLQTIADENQRFTDSNVQMAADLVTMKSDLVTCAEDIKKLRVEYDFLKALLTTAWTNDTAMEQQMTQRDLDILQKLADVLELSAKRSVVVEHVSEDMNSELSNLSSFLDTVADRRPKIEERETVESSMNTRGEQTHDKASQPGRQFVHQQQQLHEYGVEISIDSQSSQQTVIISSADNSKAVKGSRQLNKRAPLPPIRQKENYSPSKDPYRVLNIVGPTDIDVDVDD